ncbi:MAG: radical SAM family heme chaperone HemW [Chitinophagaceae bacterium]|nr:radical SAM family heme chaperone HemW [Chitinophagaceae bacterium]
MAGIYLHIPFCRKACHYCNFHFSTSLNAQNDLVVALVQEINLRKHYLQGQTIRTIYFGGGTPSLLHQDELRKILDALYKHFTIEQDAEITLEANPDDLKPDNLQFWKAAGINRLSVGVQSFFEEDLIWMNRSHSAEQARESMNLIRHAGFDNYSMDLIFGYPLLDMPKWQKNMAWMIEAGVPHISCYGLTIEPKTVFHHQQMKGQWAGVDQDVQAVQYEMLMKTLTQQGYRHYEISNFALPGREAIHNSQYWKGDWYLGLGPSAHSFNGESRQWNVSHNQQYIRGIMKAEQVFDLEYLSERDQINEFILTQLRMDTGIALDWLQERLSEQQWTNWQIKMKRLIEQEQIYLRDHRAILTPTGKLYADGIAADFFLDENPDRTNDH